VGAPDRGSGPAGIAGDVGDTRGEDTDPEEVDVEAAEVEAREPVSVLVVHDTSTKTEASA
jgi:hypothetical protein